MATDLNYIKYVVEQIDLPDISFKKMFGEYMLYYKAVPVLLVCDDCVFVKILKETSEILGDDCEQEFPYDGAKLHYVWILIIPILQDKRLLPYIIAEKTSQRNKIEMFLFARVFGLFYYYFAVFRKGVFITKLNAVFLLTLVRHKSIICQNLVILIKLDVPCGVIFIF